MMEQPEYDFLDEEVADEATEEVAESPPETVETPEPPAPEVTTAPEPKEEMVPLAALRAEREKRQRYEAQLQQYQQQFDPSVFHQDPRAIQFYVDQRLTNERVNLSRSMVAAMNPDYEEMETLFVEEAERNPGLREQLLQSENPALFAYQTAKSLKMIREARSGDLEKRLRAEIEAKVRAELQAKPSVSVPPDLSNVRSAKGSDAPVDESLESILKR